MQPIFFLLIYLIIFNVIAVLLTVFDKLRAIHHGRRVREATLLLVAALGGSPAMLVFMLMIRHKTRKPKFMVGIPLILLVQIAVAFIVWRVFYA